MMKTTTKSSIECIDENGQECRLSVGDVIEVDGIGLVEVKAITDDGAIETIPVTPSPAGNLKTEHDIKRLRMADIPEDAECCMCGNFGENDDGEFCGVTGEPVMCCDPACEDFDDCR